MSDIWEEHRRFILGLGAAVLVVLLAGRIIDASFADAAAREERTGDSIRRRLSSLPDPGRGAISRAEARRRELQEELARLAARLTLDRPDLFRVPEGARDADLRFNDATRRVREEVVDVAATLDIMVDPSLGLPEATPASQQEIVGYLAGLAVVDRVARIAIDEEVAAIHPIRIRPGTVSGFDRGEEFVETVQVEMRLTGIPDAVVSVLERLQRGESYLPLGTSSLSLTEDERGLVSADLLLMGVRVNPDRPLRRAGRRRSRS